MNEAELEAKLHAVITNVFPWVSSSDISHQKEFSIRIGHGEVNIGGRPKRGRLDILINIQGQPKAVFELKAPGLGISDDDIKQGISYARLTNPITPLLIASDSTTTKVINVYTGAEIDTANANSFTDLIKSTLTIAGAEVENAINSLTGGDETVIAEIFKNATRDAFEKMTGNANDLNKPFCRHFSINRNISKEIYAALKSTNPRKNLAIITGSAQIGKTNAAKQVVDKFIDNGSSVCYIASNQCDGILKSLERVVYNKYRISLSSTNILHWVRNYIQKGELLIVIDGVNPSDFERHRSEITTIIQEFENSSSVLLLITDTLTSSMEFKNPGRRSYSSIEDRIQLFALQELSDDEFMHAIQIASNGNCHIDKNNIGTPEFRQPRVLRTCLAVLPEFPRAYETFLPSGILADLIGLSERSNMLSPDLMRLLEKYCSAFISQSQSDVSEKMKLYAMEIGCVDSARLHSLMTREEIDELKDKGVIELREVDSTLSLTYPRDPFVLVQSASTEIARRVISEPSDVEMYKSLVSLCQLFPSSDILAVRVMANILHSDQNAFGSIIDQLLFTPPKGHSFAGRKFSGLLKFDGNVLNVRFDFSNANADDLDSEIGLMFSDYFQWLIVSMLMCSKWFQMIASDEFVAKAIYRIASYKRTQFRTYRTELTGLQHATHKIGSFEVACTNHNKVEPITMAIECLIERDFNLAKDMAYFAISRNNFPLINRIKNALCTFRSSNKEFNRLTRDIDFSYDHCIKVIAGQLIQSRNEYCMCQSGVKYKKCHINNRPNVF